MLKNSKDPTKFDFNSIIYKRKLLNECVDHLQDRDGSFKKGDLFFERSGRLGPIEWDGKGQLNYHCKKIVSIKPKQR